MGQMQQERTSAVSSKFSFSTKLFPSKALHNFLWPSPSHHPSPPASLSISRSWSGKLEKTFFCG